MKEQNYLMLNGQQIPFTEDQLDKIKMLLSDRQKRLGDIEVGDTFKIGEHEFFVLEQCGGTKVLYKGLLEESMQFGKSNNFADKSCTVRHRLEEFANELEAAVGIGYLFTQIVDLTADDGLDDYGVFRDAKVSLLTAVQYRRYVRIIDQHKVGEWWWLATPYSTPAHDHSAWVKCVSPRGRIGNYGYGHDSGVRPFCIFNSNIFVSV